MTNPAALVNRVWNFAGVLRDAGVGYGDYVEQITYLLFLKLDAENRAMHRPTRIPAEYQWETLVGKAGDELEVHYRHVLTGLSNQPGIIGTIFRKAQNKIGVPSLLERLVKLIDAEEWRAYSPDVKGDLYEGLLQRNAEDVKGGAGQYFTPRPLIDAVVRCVRPQPGQTITDPACGTGGFLLGAYEYLSTTYGSSLDRDQKRHLTEGTFYGADIVDSVVRLATMNMYLHGLGGEHSPIQTMDSLATAPSEQFDFVLANPPFGKKSSITVVTESGDLEREGQTYERPDFWATTSNKQLNFLQHIRTLLKIGGTAAVVVPDNVLFEGGAGETIRRKLLHSCNVHTLLRLPTGIFYAPGVKANVLFFERKPASETPWTGRLWVYDLRTNRHFTLKANPMRAADLEDFVRCYQPENIHQREESERFKAYDLADLLARDKANLDLFWLKDDTLEDTTSLPAPDVLAAEISENLLAALAEFNSIHAELAADPS